MDLIKRPLRPFGAPLPKGEALAKEGIGARRSLPQSAALTASASSQTGEKNEAFLSSLLREGDRRSPQGDGGGRSISTEFVQGDALSVASRQLPQSGSHGVCADLKDGAI